MNHEPRNSDRELRDLFHRARRDETARAPGFRTLARRPSDRPARRAPRLLPLAALASLALVAIAALAAVRLWVPRAEPERVARVLATTPEPAIASETAPRPPAPSPPAQPGANVGGAPARPAPPPVPPEARPGAGEDARRAASPEPARRSDVRGGPGDETAPAVQLAEEMAARVEVTAKSDAVDLEKTAPVQAEPLALAAPGVAEAEADQVHRKQVAAAAGFTEEFIRDLPVPGRFYQDVRTLAHRVEDSDGEGSPNAHGSRERDFNAIISGVSNVAALTGQQLSQSELSGGDGGEPYNAEGYRAVQENDFLTVRENPLSTFSIDVDTASYANVRRFLSSGRLPPPDAVRIEELVNYFAYDYPAPTDGAPFAASVEVADCPWDPEHRLARIGIKGREVARGESAGSNLVFLIDVSGSMQSPAKLPLLKSALALLVEQLTSRDQVAIVVYAGSSGLVLPPTPGDAKDEILGALDRLQAGGSTNGGAGLRLAYRTARESFIAGGINRVILATDGDFNVGVTSHGKLLGLIERDAEDGIFLTTLGFGYGNYQDDRLEHLADRGNGNHAYIDTLREARKVLVEEMTGTLVTIAKDVKIQVEFNPLEVGAYRLIGYENRMLKKEDFNDDRKDAGEIGAGHTVTALYELVPPDRASGLSAVDPLRYQSAPVPSEEAASGELFTLKLRYKEPEGKTSRLLAFPVVDGGAGVDAASADFKFAAAVAEFGLLLRESAHRAAASFEQVEKLALEGSGADEHGYRAEFGELVRRAEELSAAQATRD